MLLKLNERGSSWATLTPHSGQAMREEYMCSSPPTTLTTSNPEPSFIATSIEFASRFSIPSFTSSRSTTTSIVWLRRLSNLISSSIERSSPSMRARVNPCAASFSNSLVNSPLRPRTIGASSMTRGSAPAPPLPARSITRAAICSTDWRVISLPQLGQWGMPMEL